MINRDFLTEDKYNGVKKEESFMRFGNNLIGSGENVIFKPTTEGKFDFMVYVALLTLCNYEYYFLTNIKQLVQYLGYKPNGKKGRINEKVELSIHRLCTEYQLIDLHYEDECMEGEVGLVSNDECFFKMYLHKLGNIYNSFRYKNGNNKYKDKASAIYLYSYLLSMMSEHNPYNLHTFYGCFPSIEVICKDCNISKGSVTKLLKYFEYDKLIYVARYEKVESNNKSLSNGSNYYTNDKKYLLEAYYYSQGFYNSKEWKVKSGSYYTKMLCNDLDNLLKTSFKELKTIDKNILVEFKKDMQFKFLDILKDFGLKGYNDFDTKISKHNEITKVKQILFLAEQKEDWGYVLLTHFKNIILALQYKYGLK